MRSLRGILSSPCPGWVQQSPSSSVTSAKAALCQCSVCVCAPGQRGHSPCPQAEGTAMAAVPQNRTRGTQPVSLHPTHERRPLLCAGTVAAHLCWLQAKRLFTWHWQVLQTLVAKPFQMSPWALVRAQGPRCREGLALDTQSHSPPAVPAPR